MTSEELKVLDKHLKRLKTEPIKTTFLDIINKTGDENIVSNWLSFLFNPKENGIGNKIIDALLKSVNYEYNLDDDNFIEIQREGKTDDWKRMDLIIKYSNIWIVIENKIRSSEHNKQTETYYKYVEKIRSENDKNNKNKEVVYIYLRPDWNEPNNKNVPAKKFDGKTGFRNLFYSKLIEYLKNVNYFDYKEKDKFKYLKEFIEIGEKYYMGKEIKITEAVEFYMENKDKINQIKSQFDAVNRAIYNKIENELKDNFSNYYVNSASTFFQIASNKWNEEKEARQEIHYEIYSDDFKDILGKESANIEFYIHIEEKVNTEKRQKIYDRIKEKEEFRERIKKNKNNTLSISLNQIVYNFSNEEEIEKSIESIVNKMKELDKQYKEEIDQWSNLL